MDVVLTLRPHARGQDSSLCMAVSCGIVYWSSVYKNDPSIVFLIKLEPLIVVAAFCVVENWSSEKPNDPSIVWLKKLEPLIAVTMSSVIEYWLSIGYAFGALVVIAERAVEHCSLVCMDKLSTPFRTL